MKIVRPINNDRGGKVGASAAILSYWRCRSLARMGNLSFKFNLPFQDGDLMHQRPNQGGGKSMFMKGEVRREEDRSTCKWQIKAVSCCGLERANKARGDSRGTHCRFKFSRAKLSTWMLKLPSAATLEDPSATKSR